MIRRIFNALHKTPQANTQDDVPKIEVQEIMQKKSLFISAGHSDTDVGASATHNGKLWREADIVLEFRDLVAKHLLDKGVQYSKDGELGQNLPLRDAITLASTHDIAIEFHCNAFTNPNATGVETLSRGVDYPLGNRICEVIASTLRINNRGVKGESSGQHSRLGFISRGNGIIVELFFISNPNDLNAYLENKEVLAERIAELLKGVVYE